MSSFSLSVIPLTALMAATASGSSFRWYVEKSSPGSVMVTFLNLVPAVLLMVLHDAAKSNRATNEQAISFIAGSVSGYAALRSKQDTKEGHLLLLGEENPCVCAAQGIFQH